MRGEHLVVIHLVDVVAGEDHHILRVIPLAALGFHVRRKHKHAAVEQIQAPRLTRADVAVELQRLILRKHADHVDAGIGAVGEGEVDDSVFAAKGNRRFGDHFGEQTQPASLSTSEQHGDAPFLSHVVHPCLYMMKCC